MSFFNNIFNKKPRIDFATLLENGAILLDVRSEVEYRAGHAGQSINIPLENLSYEIVTLDRNIPIITVCESGMRSSRATYILQQQGYEVYNGGSWHRFK
jgi:rhodanese-related sulfurtransferase